MLPASALCRVATPSSRTEPSPRSSPPQRVASSASVYPAGIRSVTALVSPGGGGFIVPLHLCQHLIGHVHGVIGVGHTLGEDEAVLLGLGELLRRLHHVLLQFAELGVALHVVVVLEVAGLAAEVSLFLVQTALRILHL